MSRSGYQSNRADKRRATPAADGKSPRENNLQRGVHYLQRHDLKAAIACFEQAQRTDPNDAVAANCLGIVARMERRVADALSYFQQAIRLRPDFAEAHNNLGNALRDAGRTDEAEPCYLAALARKPDFADAHNNLGVAYLSRGETAAAVRCFEEAIRLQPAYAEAHNNLGNALRQRGELLDALANFHAALEVKPESAEIHNNLANVLRELGRLEESRQHYLQAVALDSNFAEAFANLGDVLNDLEQSDAATEAHLRAEQLRPGCVPSLVRLGNTHRLAGKSQLARAAFIRALSLEPHELAHAVRIAALCPPVFGSRQEMDKFGARAMLEWSRIAELSRARGGWRLTESLTEPSFNWQFFHGNLRPLREAYAQIFASSFACQKPNRGSGRPRVGMVVTRGHEGLFLRSLGGVVERINTHDMEVVIVCPRACESRLRQGIARDVPFLIIPTDLAQAAETMAAVGFDVLYYWEIGTDATNYFLPFLRLAPVQCTSWGIQVTSGIGNVEYYLASQLVEPPDAAEHYSERLLFSPTLLTYQLRPTRNGPTKSRADFGVAPDQHLYVCAQQPGKFHPDFDELLAEILRRDPYGILVVAGDRQGHATRLLEQRRAMTIPDVAPRFVSLPRLEYNDYLQLLELADVLLDPPHFGGVNSSYDAFAVGQPVVTRPSPFQRGRYTAACYRKMGISTGLVGGGADYVRLAVTLATDEDLRREMRQQVREASSSLYDDRSAVAEHERLFGEMIQASRQ